MIRLILTIMLSTLAFVSMGANDCGTPYHSDIGDSLCNLIRGDYSLHESIFRTPDKVGNLYREAECKGRRYDRGGRLLWDGEYHYSYDCEGNLVHKSLRDINATTAENGQTGDTGGKKKAGWFRLLFGSDGIEENDRRETRGNDSTDPFMDWEPGDTCYRWHANGMLAEVRTSDGKVVSFGYDALGRRVSKRTGDTLHRFGWDGNVVLHEWDTEADRMPRLVKDETGREEYDGTEKPENLVTWVYDGTSFTPVAKVTEEERYTIVHDYLGTPTQAYDSRGGLVWEMLLDVYGEVMECRGDRTLVPFRYQGQYEDVETGLYYNRFRYYSPEMGMYISSDPIGLAGNNPTLYGYVQDVNTWLDWFGLETILTSGIVYRMGSSTDSNLTPRPGKDTTTGLSTSLEKPLSGKYQAIDISKLNELEAVNDHRSHVLIRPKNDPDKLKLEEWANTRGTETQHKYTKELKEALVCH